MQRTIITTQHKTVLYAAAFLLCMPISAAENNNPPAGSPCASFMDGIARLRAHMDALADQELSDAKKRVSFNALGRTLCEAPRAPQHTGGVITIDETSRMIIGGITFTNNRGNIQTSEANPSEGGAHDLTIITGLSPAGSLIVNGMLIKPAQAMPATAPSLENPNLKTLCYYLQHPRMQQGTTGFDCLEEVTNECTPGDDACALKVFQACFAHATAR